MLRTTRPQLAQLVCQERASLWTQLLATTRLFAAHYQQSTTEWHPSTSFSIVIHDKCSQVSAVVLHWPGNELFQGCKVLREAKTCGQKTAHGSPRSTCTLKKIIGDNRMLKGSLFHPGGSHIPKKSFLSVPTRGKTRTASLSCLRLVRRFAPKNPHAGRTRIASLS